METKNFRALEFLTALAAAKRTILSYGLLLMILAAIMAYSLPARYSATTEILPPQLSRGGGAVALLSQAGASGDLASLAGAATGVQSKAQADMFVGLLTAWPIRAELVKKFDLVAAWKMPNETRAGEALAAHTVIESTKLGFITIQVTDSNPQRSAALANAYVDALRGMMQGLALTESSQRRIFYQNQMDRTKSSLAQAEEAFKTMQQKNHMVSLDSQARTMLEQSAALRSQITAKEVELQSLKSYSTESNPQVQIAETALASLRGHLSELESQQGAGAAGRSLSTVPGAELDFVRSTRELKYQETLYDLMVKQYELALVDEARDGPVIQLIEPARVPMQKSGPARVKIMLAGFAIGCIFAAVRAMFRWWKSRVDAESREDFAGLRRAIFRW